MQGPSVNPATGGAFKDVLYGGESELDDSDDEAPASRTNVLTKHKGTDHGA
jgi:ribosomal RNA-processing protein 12